MTLLKKPVFISTLFVCLLLPANIYAQYFGARYAREPDTGMSQYYCLRTDDGRIYQLLPDWIQKARENQNLEAISMDSMIQIAAYDPQAKSKLHFNYMFGRSNHVGIVTDTIRQFFNGIDSTEIKRISEDTVEIMRLSDAYSEFLGLTTRYPIRQTIVFGDTSLPAIHPVNIEFPEIGYLPKVIITKNHTWHLEEVFYEKDRINDLLAILYRDDFHPFTQVDMDNMISSFGMTKKEWWAYIQKQAEEMQKKE